MSFLPRRALDAAEALLAAEAQGKYVEPRWHKQPAEHHVVKAIRHGFAWLCSVVDRDSGRSHAHHSLSRFAFATAREMDDGREPPQPIAAVLLALDAASVALDAAAVAEGFDATDRSTWPAYWSQAHYDLDGLTAWAKRREIESRTRREGGVAWPDGNLRSG